MSILRTLFALTGKTARLGNSSHRYRCSSSACSTSAACLRRKTTYSETGVEAEAEEEARMGRILREEERDTFDFTQGSGLIHRLYTKDVPYHAGSPPLVRGFASSFRKITSMRMSEAVGTTGEASGRSLCARTPTRTFASSTGLSKSRKAQLLKSARGRKGKIVTPRLPKRRKDSTLAARDEGRRRESAAKDLVKAKQQQQQRVSNNSTSTHETLDHPAVIVTREIEMMNVFLGFEQRNKYTLRDSTGAVAGYVEEEGSGLGNILSRQMLRTRRPLRANVYDARGNLLYRIVRPFFFITSTIYIEDPMGNLIGEVRQRWHLFKRNYDLYFGKNQFGEIKGNFLAWEFEIVDESGETLALIDRNFAGFGVELFTDAGKYVIHYGADASGQRRQLQNHQSEVGSSAGLPQMQLGLGGQSTKVTEMSKWRTNVKVVEEENTAVDGGTVEVARPLSLNERAVTLAAVISIDSDFFSRHSAHHGVGGGGMPFFFPFPMGGIFGGGEDLDDASAEDAQEAGGGEVVDEDGASWLDQGELDESDDEGGFFDGWGDWDGGDGDW